MDNERMPMLDPSHPGEVIRDEIIAPLGLTIQATAEILGVTCQSLSALLDEHASLSPEMAIRIEKAFGTSASNAHAGRP